MKPPSSRPPSLPPPNLILTGFMGTGKSSLARILAERWHRPLLDTDRLIEERAGMSIPEIFATHGEAAFRAMERQCIEEWLPENNAVIACGGGLIVADGMNELLKTKGVVICLSATAETIYRRIAQSGHRPLLRTEDPLARIKELLAEREPAYSRVGIGIFTDGRSFAELANHIERLYRTEVLRREQDAAAGRAAPPRRRFF
jgi:shikimate kinase